MLRGKTMKLLLERWNKYLKEAEQLSLPLGDKEAPQTSELLPEQEAALENNFKMALGRNAEQMLNQLALDRLKIQGDEKSQLKLVADPYSLLKSYLNQSRLSDSENSQTALFPTEDELKSLNITSNGERVDAKLPVFYDFANSEYDYDVDKLKHIRAKYVNRILQMASEKTGNKIQAWFSPDGTNYRLNVKDNRQNGEEVK
jgi:hypothetical protein